ncbi:MAG: S-formylglutathione hydrolase [Acidobacteria bacterium]|nr:S-formylglutathione hydrolase [Acidobacteriota bacterium]
MKRRSTYRVCNGELSFWSHESETCGLPMNFSVFMPPARGPVLYWLSGLTCTDENFMVKAAPFRKAAELGLALVACDTSPRDTGIQGEDREWDLGSGAGFYVDATQQPWAPFYQMYSYVVDELPKVVESNFDVVKGVRGISGHSMGGHGALVIGLRNPNLYRSLSAFSPISAPSKCPWGEKAFGAYLGDDRSNWRAYDAHCLIGESDWDRPILVDQGLNDTFLHEQLMPEQLVSAAERAGKNLDLRYHEGYGHSYYFVQTFIEEHLAFHAGFLIR